MFPATLTSPSPALAASARHFLTNLADYTYFMAPTDIAAERLTAWAMLRADLAARNRQLRRAPQDAA